MALDPFTLPLALGCSIIFSQVDMALTKQFGDVPDALFYRMVTLRDSRGRERVLESPRPHQAFSPSAEFRMGKSPDGLFASYLYSAQGARRTAQDVRFISATSCNRVDFVRASDGATVGAERYQGWMPDSPHNLRVWRDGGRFDIGLPLDEARRLNPDIKD